MKYTWLAGGLTTSLPRFGESTNQRGKNVIKPRFFHENETRLKRAKNVIVLAGLALTGLRMTTKK